MLAMQMAIFPCFTPNKTTLKPLKLFDIKDHSFKCSCGMYKNAIISFIQFFITQIKTVLEISILQT